MDDLFWLTQLDAEGQDVETIMMDATHLKVHRTASSLRGKKGVEAFHQTGQARAKLKTARGDRCEEAPHRHVSERGADQRLYRRAAAAVTPAGGRDFAERSWI